MVQTTNPQAASYKVAGSGCSAAYHYESNTSLNGQNNFCGKLISEKGFGQRAET